MNEFQRKQEALATQKRQFAQAVARGQAGALDRMGQQIEAGDKILLHTEVDLIFDVVSVNPVLDPRVPPGVMEVAVTVTFPLQIPAGRPFPKVVIIARRQPAEAQPGTDNGTGETAPEETQAEPSGLVDASGVPLEPTT